MQLALLFLCSKIYYKTDEIIGTWTGSTGDFTDPDRIINQFVFNNDGKYSFTKIVESKKNIEGYPYVENGIYELSHEDNTTETYHSTLTMKHDEEITVVKFYLSGKEPMLLILDDSTSPTYIKE